MENLFSNLLPVKILLDFLFSAVIRIVLSLRRSPKQFLKFSRFTEARNKFIIRSDFLA